MPGASDLRSIDLPRARLRSLAKQLLSIASHPAPITGKESPIKIVCVSDTHNQRPDLPPGDLLLHAGDLSEWGSFDEIQTQLTWISSQPHTHKVIIAGNHDVLFDKTFLSEEKDRFPVNDGQTAADLDFGSITYLQDSQTILDFPELGRKCTIYGSPWTPKYVRSAFQYDRDDDPWIQKIPKNVDILLTHGPPYRRLDGALHSGCPHLAQAIEEARPKLVVYGHIHVGHGREKLVLDGLRRRCEDIERGWSGWEVIPAMLLLYIWAKITTSLGNILQRPRAERSTEYINAAILGIDNKPQNEATVTYI